jgi:hypothetical protein
MGQAGAALGQRIKAKWEWMAVLGQAEVYGWTRIDARCRSNPIYARARIFCATAALVLVFVCC